MLDYKINYKEFIIGKAAYGKHDIFDSENSYGIKKFYPKITFTIDRGVLKANYFYKWLSSFELKIYLSKHKRVIYYDEEGKRKSKLVKKHNDSFKELYYKMASFQNALNDIMFFEYKVNTFGGYEIYDFKYNYYIETKRYECEILIFLSKTKEKSVRIMSHEIEYLEQTREEVIFMIQEMKSFVRQWNGGFTAYL